jgi:small GTP-binding protein
MLPPLRVSVLVCGPRGGVGKTSLVRRLAEGAFAPSVRPTVGVDFGVLPVALGDGRPVRLDIFDLSGAAAFADTRAELWRDARVLVLVFDAASAAGVDALDDVLAEARAGGVPATAPLIVVGTKIDAAREGAAGAAAGRARAWAAAHGAPFVETSALSGEGVENVRAALARAAASIFA